jgi:hypothetical protein
MNQLAHTIKKLLALRKLEYNWDSYKALPINEVNILNAIDLIVKLADSGVRKPHVNPVPDGTILLEWENLDVYISDHIEWCTDYLEGYEELTGWDRIVSLLT